MSPLEILMNEHRLIEKALDALDVFVDALPDSGDVTRADLGRFVAFIRGFADAHHHGKEEDILFKAMSDAGMPTDVGPLAVMYAEHTEGRGYTNVMADVAEGTGALDEGDLRELRRGARSYTMLLRGHIQKEDQVLYPMADHTLPEAAWQGIERAFDAFEQDPENAKRAADLRAVAEDLCERYSA